MVERGRRCRVALHHLPDRVHGVRGRAALEDAPEQRAGQLGGGDARPEDRLDVGDRRLVDLLRVPDARELVDGLHHLGRGDHRAGVDQLAPVQRGPQRHRAVVDGHSAVGQGTDEPFGVVRPLELERVVHVRGVVTGGHAVGPVRVELGWSAVHGHDRDVPRVGGAGAVGGRGDRAGGVRDAAVARRHEHVDTLRAHLLDEAGVPLGAHPFEVGRGARRDHVQVLGSVVVRRGHEARPDEASRNGTVGQRAVAPERWSVGLG